MAIKILILIMTLFGMFFHLYKVDKPRQMDGSYSLHVLRIALLSETLQLSLEQPCLQALFTSWSILEALLRSRLLTGNKRCNVSALQI